MPSGVLNGGLDKLQGNSLAAKWFGHKKAGNGPNRFLIDSLKGAGVLQEGVILSGGYSAPAHRLVSGISQDTRYFPGANNLLEGLVVTFPFLAVPFFILAGEIMNEAGITKRLVDFANILVGGL